MIIATIGAFLIVSGALVQNTRLIIIGAGLIGWDIVKELSQLNQKLSWIGENTRRTVDNIKALLEEYKRHK